MDFYEPFEEMEANNVCFFSIDNLWSGLFNMGTLLSDLSDVNIFNRERNL